MKSDTQWVIDSMRKTPGHRTQIGSFALRVVISKGDYWSLAVNATRNINAR